jgi:hypothetical protein
MRQFYVCKNPYAVIYALRRIVSVREEFTMQTMRQRGFWIPY